MANSTHPQSISMLMTSVAQWFQKNLLHPICFMQVGAILVLFATLCFGQLAYAKDTAQTSKPATGAATEQAVASDTRPG